MEMPIIIIIIMSDIKLEIGLVEQVPFAYCGLEAIYKYKYNISIW